MTLAESSEMYLETILILREKNHFVRSVDIADHMRFSKPSVSRAIHLLQEAGYIAMDSNHMITLTESGEKVATSMYERHKLLTRCLTDLGVDPYIAAVDACKIEHDISEETFQVLKRYTEKKDAEKSGNN